jgi:hypothetical protein
VRGWPVRTAVLSLVAAALAAVFVVPRIGRGDDLDDRLAAANRSRELSWALAVPGYVPATDDYGDGFGGGTFSPSDPAALPPDSTGDAVWSVSVTLSADSQDPCLADAGCAPDGPGLTYVQRSGGHGYAIRHGAASVRVMGGRNVDRALLRKAALDARPATDAELRHLLLGRPG